jgi:hypothetical protein
MCEGGKMKVDEFLKDEYVLDDNYPVNWDFIYIADNDIIRSNIKGTVLDLKRDTKAKEIRRCDIVKRGLLR